MKIAFLSTITKYPWGGADFMWTRAAEAALKRGDTLLLVVSQEVARHPRVAALVAGGAKLHLPKKPSLYRSLARKVLRRAGLLEESAAIPAALDSFCPDLLVFSCGATYDLAYLPAWVDWLISNRSRFRLIANWQMELPSLGIEEKSRVLKLFRAADALFFVSRRNLDITRGHLQESLPNAKVLHNPLRWKYADQSPWPTSPPWNFATVSRLDPGKGIGFFMEAAAQVLPRNNEWALHVHGLGPEKENLQSLASRLGIENHVRFAGYVPDLSSIWSQHHLLVSASIEDGVPMTIPEALLCRRPVLSTAVGGAKDWITDGLTGFISPGSGQAALAETLETAWNQRSRWEAMGREGENTAALLYRPDDYLETIQP